MLLFIRAIRPFVLFVMSPSGQPARLHPLDCLPRRLRQIGIIPAPMIGEHRGEDVHRLVGHLAQALAREVGGFWSSTTPT